ncbi:MAG: prenyltransferase/squalene oxidase repeat-containing protein [Planctomycetota bacterium]
MTRVALCLLVILASASAGENGTRWHSSLKDARKVAKPKRRPILCVLLGSGSASRGLKRTLASRKLQPLLDRFVCVKPGAAERAKLVKKYDLKGSPASIVFASIGSPLKLVVGPTSTARYAENLEHALQKHVELWKPRRPETVTKPEAPKPARNVLHRSHDSACPKRCSVCEPALKRGLRWLVSQQRGDGRFAKAHDERVRKNADGRELTRSIDEIGVALTALSGLALLSAGQEPAPDSKQGRAVAKAVRYLMGRTRESGLVSQADGNDHLFLAYSNFETSFAAVFLAEAHRRSPNRELPKILTAIASYLARIQDPESGGWGYGPEFRSHDPRTRRGWRLLATTQCALVALAHLRDTGVAVPKVAFERGARYLRSCRGRDGLFVYEPRRRGEAGTAGATAGALFALERCASPDAPTGAADVEAAHRRLRETFPAIDATGEHAMFSLLFGALAMNHAGPGAGMAFHRHTRDLLLHDQKPDGSWADPEQKGGSIYATAIALTVLQRPAARLALFRDAAHALKTSAPPPSAQAGEVRYGKPPHAKSRVKVFERNGGGGPRYGIDLVISVEGRPSGEYLENLRTGVLGANRILFDVTDGQMSLHRVTVHQDKAAWDLADIMITKDFFDQAVNPHPWAHGMTRLSRITDLRRGTKRPGRRIGDWILFPPTGIQWEHPRFMYVLAHELCHYLLGARDEYNQRGGESYCACIQGLRGFSELCDETNHTDDRQDASCWALAKALYPKLRVPERADPGPWDPPAPVVTLPAHAPAD